LDRTLAARTRDSGSMAADDSRSSHFEQLELSRDSNELDAWLQLFARLTLNAGKHTGDQPARLVHLDHGNDRAILIQGDEGRA
jgi:hypothetical protein